MVNPNQEIDKTCLKKDSWLAKGMVVLVKRKVQRKVRSRSAGFRELMAILAEACGCKQI